MIISTVEQGTPEWLAERAGRPTASNFSKIVTSTGAPSKQAKGYMHQLAGERLIGTCVESFKSDYMQRGNDLESEARGFYELVSGNTVEQVGICYRDETKSVSCSPDGLVGDDGGIEVKCPSLSVHVGYLLGGKLPTDYFQQVQGCLWVTGREWWDFVSYFPGVDPLIVRVFPDHDFFASLDAEVERFCAQLDEIYQKLSSL